MNKASENNDWLQCAEKLQFESRAFVDGGYYNVGPSDTFETVNPATKVTLAAFPDSDTNTVDHAVESARKAFKPWWQLAPDQRKVHLLALADRLQQHRDEIALLDCLEMGKPISMALDEVDSAAGFLRFNAELVDKIYGEVAPTEARCVALSQAEPRGVVGIISPWNFPLLTAMIAIAPALAAGNAVVVKPSEQTPSSTLKLAELAAEAGLPGGVINVVPGKGITSGAALASHADIDIVHFTGSTRVGRQLMVYAGQSNGKPLMLELGGKSPQIVFEDGADLPNLGAVLAQAAFHNTGQLCAAKTRLLVHESIQQQVIEAIKEATKNIFRVGDPLDVKSNFGPIASRQQLDRVNKYRDLGSAEGAQSHLLTTAGEMPTSGYFMQPILFDKVDNHSRIAQEEIFGPVLSVISFKSDDQAIQLANDARYGLAATAYTADFGRAHRLARELTAGDISICSTTELAAPTASVSQEPFGASGYGILGGRRGLEAYQRVKAARYITACS